MINEYHYAYKTTYKVRRSRHEEIPYIQGQRKPSKTVGARVAVRRYLQRAKEKPQQGGRRGEFTFRIKPHSCQTFRGLKQTLLRQNCV